MRMAVSKIDGNAGRIYGGRVSTKSTATPADRADVTRVVLGGLADGEPLGEVLRRLLRFDDYEFPFPGDVLTEIGAYALAVAGASRVAPVSLADATEQHLPEWTISGNTARQKHRAALQAAIAVHAGIVVDYYE